MQLKGSQVLQATPVMVWGLLMDTEVLARITPGITRLEPTGDDVYRAIADIKMGPVKGSFFGDLAVVHKNPPHHFRLDISQESKIGNVSAEIMIRLEAVNGTEAQMSFNGKARLSGVLARTGQRVLTGVANTLTKQFFNSLIKELEQNNHSSTKIEH